MNEAEKQEPWYGVGAAEAAFRRGDCTCAIENAHMEANVDRRDIPISAYISHRERCPVHRQGDRV